MNTTTKGESETKSSQTKQLPSTNVKKIVEREKVYFGHHLESERWNLVPLRKTDIIISTYVKSGTTWTQSIMANLLFKDPSNFPGPVTDIFPWVDMRIPPLESLKALEEQTHRRVMKSHLPATALDIYEEVKYVVVARDPRDVFMSLFNHWSSMSDSVMMRINELDEFPFPKPTDDVNLHFQEWLSKSSYEWEDDGYPYWSYFYFLKTWWKLKDLKNVHVIHYADLKRDLRNEITKLAKFCEIEIESEELLEKICSNVSFDTMKSNSQSYLSNVFQSFFKGGAESFLYRGTNNRWKEVLNEKSLAAYEEKVSKLPNDIREWLERS